MKLTKESHFNPIIISLTYAVSAFLFFYFANFIWGLLGSFTHLSKGFITELIFVVLSSVILFFAIYMGNTASDRRNHLLNLIATAVDTINEGIVISDTEGSILWVNPAFCNLTGYSEKELMGTSIKKFLQYEIAPEYYNELSEKLRKGEICSDYILSERKSGDLYYEEYAITPFKANHNDVSHFIMIKRDITDSTMNMISLEESLKEKETLLSEIHHRVKNNLAMISGLIDLQLFQSKNDETNRILHNTQIRLKSIALVHEKLYNNYLFSEIDFEDYLKNLVDQISQMFDSENRVSILMNTVPLTINMEKAVPFGLLCTEIITNAYKHAFINRTHGEIRIILKKLRNGNYSLSVKDDGVGLTDASVFDNPNLLGLKLIKTLAKQINAKIKIEDADGFGYTLIFNLSKHDRLLEQLQKQTARVSSVSN